MLRAFDSSKKQFQPKFASRISLKCREVRLVLFFLIANFFFSKSHLGNVRYEGNAFPTFFGQKQLCLPYFFCLCRLDFLQASESAQKYTTGSIGHFRVTLNLSFKSTCEVLWKLVFIHVEIRTNCSKKKSHVDSLWKRGCGDLRNGLFHGNGSHCKTPTTT